MYDSEDHRKVANNWREYVSGFKETTRVYSWVWRELVSSEAKRWFYKMSAWTVITILLYLSISYYIAIIVDAAVAGDTPRVMWAFAGLATTYLVTHATDYKSKICREWVLGLNMGEIDERMNRLFFEKSMGQHLAENSKLSASNLEKGRARVFELQNLMLFDGLNSVLTLNIALLYLWILSPVAGVVMTMVLGCYMLSSMYLNHSVQLVCTPLDTDFRFLNRWRVSRWDNVERSKANAKEEEEASSQRAYFNQVIKRDRSFWIGYIRHLAMRGTLADLAVIGILLYAFWQIDAGTWQVGIMLPMFMWSRNVRNNLWRIGNIEQQLNWNLASVKSTMEALTMKPDVVDLPDAVDLPDGPVSIEVKGLCHAFADGDDVLKDVSFTVKPGEKLAIIGKSGAGKSTFMEMLLRYRDPRTGSIRINDVDLRELKHKSFLEGIGYISQNPCVFDGTVRDNLLYALSAEQRELVSDKDLLDLMSRLKLDLDGRLKEGLDTIVGRSGMKLSGGEAQRLMIGAAAIKKPRLMIIDEATSSLDVLTEAGIHEGLKQVLTKDMTVVIITHRLSTVRDLCDKFIVLRRASELVNGDSQIEAEAESFEELYKISPTFRLMADKAGVHIAN